MTDPIDRHLYAQAGPRPSDDDQLVGTLDTAELAAEACEARMLAGNLRWLLDGGHAVELNRHPEIPGRLEPYRVLVRKGAAWTVRFGTGPGDVLAKALEWARSEGAGPRADR